MPCCVPSAPTADPLLLLCVTLVVPSDFLTHHLPLFLYLSLSLSRSLSVSLHFRFFPWIFVVVFSVGRCYPPAPQLVYCVMSHVAIAAHMMVLKEYGGVTAVLVGNTRKSMTIALSYILFPKVSPYERRQDRRADREGTHS